MLNIMLYHICTSIPEMVILVWVFCLLNRGTLHLKYLAVILVIQWDRQMDINYTWSVFKPKWFSRSTDPGYGSCCNDNICSTLRSGKDTPFTFHAHWIGQRLLVSEDFLEDHTHTRIIRESKRSLLYCLPMQDYNSLFSEHCSAHWPVSILFSYH